MPAGLRVVVDKDGLAVLMGQAAEPTTVIFVCQGCLATYKASQANARSKGSFRCEDCRHLIHEWDGAYSYTRWRQFDPSQDD